MDFENLWSVSLALEPVVIEKTKAGSDERRRNLR
jgi:hypothetical protein